MLISISATVDKSISAAALKSLPRPGTALRQCPYLGRHHREPPPLFACACSLHRRVQRKDVSLKRDAIDDLGDLANALRRLLDDAHGATHLVHRHSAAVGNDLRLGREPASLLRRVGRLPHRANAATGEFGDMIAMGILDPTKVTRSALQNAASIAGLMITTEAMVAELPKKEAPAHDHGGGGMGGMGGMDF